MSTSPESESLHLLRLSLSSELVVAGRNWRRTADLALSGFGLSSAAALPLLIIGRHGQDGVRQVTLAHAVGIEGPSLVRVLDQLCAAQLAQRVEDAADRRAKIVSLTDAGRKLTQGIEERLATLRERVLKDVSTEDLLTTLRVVRCFAEDPMSPALQSQGENAT
jgi:MarR family transcriptional regulator for hemolysin